MDLTSIKDHSQKTLQGKHAAAEIASCGEDIKKMRFSCSTTDVSYYHATESKENMIEMPLDMSQGSKCGVLNQQLVEQKTQSLDLSLRVLRETLRNEETALLLLKKLRRSQLTIAVGGGLTLIGSNHCQNSLVNGNITVASRSNAAGHVLVRQQSTDHMPSQNTNMLSMQHVAARHKEINSQALVKNQVVVSGTTTVKEANVRLQQPCPPATIQQTHEQTLAQRQALAKLAIRRQLEATLLQLQMPKANPQEMSFIPTVGFDADFITLIGMEEAVACITNEEATAELAVEAENLQPLQCARCQTDFTPQWKPEEKGAKSVICEQCVTKRRRQDFREEHTARLKVAFFQALQQERQIELGGAVVGAVA